jgi:Cu-processing system permease protein
MSMGAGVRTTAIIAGSTLLECRRRRVFLVVPVLSVAFLALYSVGAFYAGHNISAAGGGGDGGAVDTRTLAGATMLGLAMFATLFMGAVLAVFLTFDTVRGDAERGLLQPLVVRPAGRPAVMLGRLAAAVAVSSSYVAVLYAVTAAVTDVAVSWHPDHPVLPGIDIAVAVAVVAAICLLGSVFLSTIANGLAVLMVFGGGLIAGLLGQIGYAISSDKLQSIGRVTAWALPFEALYQAGLHSLTADTQGITGVIVHLGPLGGAEAAGPLLGVWVAGYLVVVVGLALLAFARRDL